MDRTAYRERVMILDRFLTDGQLKAAGLSEDISWFKENTVEFENRLEAEEALADFVTTAEELQGTLNRFELEKPRFPWFLGQEYTVEWLEDRVSVTEEERRDTRREINEKLAEMENKDPTFGSALKTGIRKGHNWTSEIHARLYPKSTSQKDGIEEEKSLRELNDVTGAAVSWKENHGHIAVIAMELLKPFHRGSRGVLPADEVTVEEEVFAIQRDAEEIFRSRLGPEQPIEKGSEIWVDEPETGHGRIRVDDVSPEGKVEIASETEINVERNPDRSSVMEGEMTESERLKRGTAELILEVLREKGSMRKERILNEVKDSLSPEHDVYHVAETERVEEDINAGLRWLSKKGEVIKSGTGYEMAGQKNTEP